MAQQTRKKFVVLFQGDSTTSENKYIKFLEKECIRAKIIPVLSFNFINKEKLQECLYNSDRYSGIIFTSTRAVSAISSSLIPPIDSCVEQWLIKNNFSVGKATADNALSVLNLDTLGSDCGDSENLCQLIINKCARSSKPLLFPCSNIRKDTIPTTLSQKGIPIEEVVCYETIPNKNFESLWQKIILEEGLPDILIFFSPSGVQSCIEIVRNSYLDSKLPKFIAIGRSTEKSLLEANIPCKVSEKPAPESVVRVVKNLLDA